MSNFLRNKMIMLRSILASIPFCLRHLPLRQAVKLPILVYKPKYLSQKGRYVIDCHNVRFGMIRMGFLRCALYPDTGVTIKNEGKIVFKGTCTIGNDTFIVCGRQGTVVFGDDFRNKGGMKLVANCGITFGKTVSVGWECIILDTNFHPLVDMKRNEQKKAFGPITIGDYNWLGLQCYVMPGVTTPERCIFGARSILTKSGEYESYCVHGGSPLKVLTRNVMRDFGHDRIYDYCVED